MIESRFVVVSCVVGLDWISFHLLGHGRRVQALYQVPVGPDRGSSAAVGNAALDSLNDLPWRVQLRIPSPPPGRTAVQWGASGQQLVHLWSPMTVNGMAMPYDGHPFVARVILHEDDMLPAVGVAACGPRPGEGGSRTGVSDVRAWGLTCLLLLQVSLQRQRSVRRQSLRPRSVDTLLRSTLRETLLRSALKEALLRSTLGEVLSRLTLKETVASRRVPTRSLWIVRGCSLLSRTEVRGGLCRFARRLRRLSKVSLRLRCLLTLPFQQVPFRRVLPRR